MPFPPIEPYAHGMLDVGDGNQIYWETCGTPAGKPAVVVHGGPGGGCAPRHRRSFDPDAYRVVLFDQRGCGRSTPHASDPSVDMSFNTTEHLIEDLEALREHLGIERWLLHGGSWGSTLILAYAERYPQRISEIVIASVTTTRGSEIDWLYHGVRRFFPEQWEQFRAGVPEDERDGNLVVAYARLMNSGDPELLSNAAEQWCIWEDAVNSADPGGRKHGFTGLPRDDRLAIARICAHYFANGAWLDEGILLREAGKLAGIPGVLIHGRVDMGGPLITAWELANAWPDAELVVLDAGHTGNDAMRNKVDEAIRSFGS